MALIIADRVRETSTTTGLGNLALAGAQPGAKRFGDRMAVGDTTWYAITGPGGAWETGVGTYVAADTLERTLPLESSNGDARVNFAAGTKDVFVTVPAKRTIDPDSALEVLVDSYTGARLNGQTQLVLDLPAAFSTFRLLIDSVAAATFGDLIIRCGPAGGALHAGASDYSVINEGVAAGQAVVGAGAVSFGGLATIGPNGIALIESIISDGSSGFWRIRTNELSQASNGAFNLLHRSAVFTPTSGAKKRLAILSSQPFVNSGSIKIYGVRP